MSYQTSNVSYNLSDGSQLLSATINISTSGDNTIIVGVGGQIIRVYRIFANAASSVAVTPKDGAATLFTGPLTLGSFALDLDAEPWFVGSTGNGFVLNLGAAVQVSGRIYYTQS